LKVSLSLHSSDCLTLERVPPLYKTCGFYGCERLQVCDSL